jgi:hypothetical protein
MEIDLYLRGGSTAIRKVVSIENLELWYHVTNKERLN